MAPFSKLETVLKQAEGLVSVGQMHTALQSLTEMFSSKQFFKTILINLPYFFGTNHAPFQSFTLTCEKGAPPRRVLCNTRISLRTQAFRASSLLSLDLFHSQMRRPQRPRKKLPFSCQVSSRQSQCLQPQYCYITLLSLSSP